MENQTEMVQEFKEELEQTPEKQKLGDELTPRQWKLYNLLKSDPMKWWTQKEICDNIPEYHYIESPKKTGDHCSTIGNDKVAINESQMVDKLIVMEKYCFKIGTLEEALFERAKHIRKLENQVKYVKAIEFKLGQHNNVKLYNNILEELKDENEQYHETYFEE